MLVELSDDSASGEVAQGGRGLPTMYRAQGSTNHQESLDKDRTARQEADGNIDAPLIETEGIEPVTNGFCDGIQDGIMIVPPGSKSETVSLDDERVSTRDADGSSGLPVSAVAETPCNTRLGVPDVIEYEPVEGDNSLSVTPTMVERDLGGANNGLFSDGVHGLSSFPESMNEAEPEARSIPSSNVVRQINGPHANETEGTMTLRENVTVSRSAPSLWHALSFLPIAILSFSLGYYCSKRELQQSLDLQMLEVTALHAGVVDRIKLEEAIKSQERLQESKMEWADTKLELQWSLDLQLMEAKKNHAGEVERIKQQSLQEAETQCALRLEESKSKISEGDKKRAELENLLEFLKLEAKKVRLEEASMSEKRLQETRMQCEKEKKEFILKLHETKLLQEDNYYWWNMLHTGVAAAAGAAAQKAGDHYFGSGCAK